MAAAQPQEGRVPERPGILAQILGAAIADELRPQQPEAQDEGHLFDRPSRVARADPKVTDRAYRVLSCLEGMSWGSSRVCTATNRVIGRESGGVGPEAVRRALRLLEELGYIRIDPDPSRMRGQRIVILYQHRQPIEQSWD